MKLYDHPQSGNAAKARIVAAYLGLELEIVVVDLFKGEQRNPEFLAKNPDGRIPVLELDDGTCLPESNAIIYYLAKGSDLRGGSEEEDARILGWLFFEQNVSEPAFAGMRFWKRFGGNPDLGGDPEEAARRRPILEASARRALKIMDTHLASHEFFALDRFTIADVAVFVYTDLLPETDFDASEYTHVQEWLARVREELGSSLKKAEA